MFPHLAASRHLTLIACFCTLSVLLISGCDSDDPTVDDGLPPDPGEEGMLTLAGIDSDEDGVRDDVQRLVVLNYESEEVRIVLFDLVRATQDAILSETEGLDLAQIRSALSLTVDCLVTRDVDIASQASTEVVAAMVNTPARSDAYVTFNVASSGTFEELSPTAEETCTRGATPPLANVITNERRAVVVFSNGMFNDWVAARLSARTLAQKMRQPGGLPQGYEDTGFTLAYNLTEDGLLFEILEVARQLAGATYGTILEILASGDLPDWFEQWIESAIASIDEAAYVIDEDLNTQVQFYRTLVDQGQKVVIVGHSQGNFYANQSCRLLDSPSLGVVGVATPATQVCDDDQPYTTLYNDAIINLIARSASWLVLPANTPDTAGGTISSHKFVDDYLAGGNSGPQVVDHIGAMLLSLQQPDVTIGTGPITVSLEWGAEPDVDLHVFEPDGSHVYYVNMTGTFGTLDRDDVDGFGPENYHVPEATLGEGIYWVGVNYYRGDNSEIARVQITTAGTTYQAIQRELVEERGSSGNSDPIPVAEIDVVRTGNEYSYTVREVNTPPPVQPRPRDTARLQAPKAQEL